MADRQRTTWGGKAGRPTLPVERARTASAHPATPDEGAAHPAYQPDPDAHAYENGDTSSWAEDPTTGPYPNSAHPATPDEGPAHPAHKAAARDLRAAVEAKAAKCIRIAQHLLGARASVASIENQAFNFMDMPDHAVQETLDRLAGKKSEDEEVEEEVVEDKTASDDEDEEEDKTASDDEDKEEDEGKTASALDQILSKLGGIEARIAALETGATTTTAADDDEDDEETILASLLAEEGMGDSVTASDDVEAMLNEMVACEDMAPVADMTMIDEEPVLDIDMGLGDDPMGMFGEDMMDGDESAILAQLYASDDSITAADDEDEDEEPKASKTASAQRPRPKKASAGASRLGGVHKEASAEISELEKLWATAPDVSGNF